MGLRNFLVCTVIFSAVSAHSFNEPWLRDPLLVSLWKLTTAINDFGFDLFKDLTSVEEGNVLICPCPISSVLSILYTGSSGETEKELRDVLGYAAVNLTKDEAAQTFYMLATQHLKSSNPKFYLFDSPSTIVVNGKTGLLPTFQKVVEVLYQIPITVTDFIESAEQVIQSINDWVAARTGNKIRYIIESVNPFSDIVVLSAAFFKGTWVHKFRPEETRPDIFYNKGNISQPMEVEMMHLADIFNFYRNEHHSILEMPFRSRNVSMMVLLPNEIDGIDQLISEFNPDFLEDQILQMTPTDVDVALPKFKMTYTADLSSNLARMGIEALFRPDQVDLSKMIRRDSVTVDEIRQKIMMSVNENGVDTAATKTLVEPDFFSQQMPDFDVDHPFLLIIYERRIKMILFMARVMEMY